MRFFGRIKSTVDRIWSLLFEKNRLPRVLFESCQVVDMPPSNETIVSGELWVVENRGNSRWALFRCPCGCNHVITLSLQKVHSPHWVISHSQYHRPTLMPSVRQLDGCCSHFWLKDGRVFWCEDTGKMYY